MKLIDLRSDTVTKPSPGMLAAMMKAEVGDDVFGEDPTVNLLQARMASLFRKDAGLFVPSGTMGNEICIKARTRPGDEIIVEQDSHIFVYETGAPSLLSGVQMMTITGRNGMIALDDLKRAVRPDAYYLPATRLICLENTHGRSGGTVLPLDEIARMSEFARSEKIATHLDGARLWNACVASGISAAEYAQHFDSVSVCFSKGLGAPIGSMILGSHDFIGEARKYRKIFGGGMRQAGILAAAAIYALDHNVERLKEDHEKASYFAQELRTLNGVRIDLESVQTNMVFIETRGTGKTQKEVLQLLSSKGILMTPERASSVRAVMHLDVSMEEVTTAVSVLKQLFR